MSQVATSHHADDEQYLASSRAIGEANLHHRKHWEWAYIHATAVHADVIGDGRSALGFGVGSEPLVAAIAAAGSTVLATDQRPETEHDEGSAFGGDQVKNDVAVSGWPDRQQTAQCMGHGLSGCERQGGNQQDHKASILGVLVELMGCAPAADPADAIGTVGC